MKNIAYVDGQNLHMGTTKSDTPWSVDLVRFRVYLEKKYDVLTAYYYIGFWKDEHQILYEDVQKAGFILIFRKHSAAMVGAKKGNVDSDIIFSVMKRMYKREKFKKIILVSGDGDFKMLVDFLIEEGRFEKILFPDGKKASSLYRSLGNNFFSSLNQKSLKSKIRQKKRVP